MEGLDPRVVSNIISDADNISPTEKTLKEELQAQGDTDADKIRTYSANTKSVGDIQRESVLEDEK